MSRSATSPRVRPVRASPAHVVARALLRDARERAVECLDPHLGPLAAAGLPAVFRQEPLGADALCPFRAAIDRLLDAHDPYPALVVDGHWNVAAADDAAAGLFGDALVGSNLIHRYATAHEAIDNWPAVAGAALRRLEEQLRRAPDDADLRELVAVVEVAAGDAGTVAPAGDELVICPHFRAETGSCGRSPSPPASSTRSTSRSRSCASSSSIRRDADAERFFQGAAAVRRP